MATCFVIQPFDRGKYDKRYVDCFEPAIRSAGLDAYRVDHDPAVEIPISSIEDGIRSAAICLADITENNANVWYELGFALASGRPVIMVCADTRERFPFDIQHRKVIVYKTESASDFDSLRTAITANLKAKLTKSELLKQVAEVQLVSDVKGLSNPELVVMAAIASEVNKSADLTSLYGVKQDAERQGLTSLGFQLALRKLEARGFVRLAELDSHQDSYDGLGLTAEAWVWMELNQSLFVVTRPAAARAIPRTRKPVSDFADDFADEDIPF